MGTSSCWKILAACIALSVSGLPLPVEPGNVQRMVDVGGYRLHLSISGSGSPAVVFENGMGEDLTTWERVQPAIAAMTTTVCYDRAGLGTSDPSSNNKDARSMVKDLHALLRGAHVPPPYVLVGHSLGGAMVQVFAGDYPDETAGLVLVDPEDGRLIHRLESRLPPQLWKAHQKAVADSMSQMPPPVKKELDAADLTGEQAEKAVIPQVPLVLLTGTLKNPDFPGNPEEQDIKMEMHREFMAGHSGAQQVLSPESRHYIQNDAPDKVIAGILQVVRTARLRK